MKPIREAQLTLVDLLDRVLEKGVVIQADLIVSVAGIPLIGVNLRAAIAGMETMVKYGIMRDWDEAIRAREGGRKQGQVPALDPGEEILISMLGSKHCTRGIYTTWSPGRVFLTNKRLILYNKAFQETVFETPIEQIDCIALGNRENSIGIVREEIQMGLGTGEMVRLRVEDAQGLIEDVKSRSRHMGHTLGTEVIGRIMPGELSFLGDGEELICEGKMWHLARPQGSPGLMEQLWRPGTLYITTKRLIWVSALEDRRCLEMESSRIRGVTLEQRRPSKISKERLVLDMIYLDGNGKEVASFAGADDQIPQWHRILEMVSEGGLPEASGQEMESCPACGRRNFTERLLSQGCTFCGWLSPRAARMGARPQEA